MMVQDRVASTINLRKAGEPSTETHRAKPCHQQQRGLVRLGRSWYLLILGLAVKL